MIDLILFPKVGGSYWMVTDFWEKFHTIPVVVTSIEGNRRGFGQLMVMARLDGICAGRRNGKSAMILAVIEAINPATRRELFRTQRAAQKYANRLNERVVI